MRTNERADPMSLHLRHTQVATGDFPAFAYTGYRRTQKKTGPRKRHRDYTVNDFVDTSRAVVGSSEESDKRGMERDSHSRIEVHEEEDDDFLSENRYLGDPVSIDSVISAVFLSIRKIIIYLVSK